MPPKEIGRYIPALQRPCRLNLNLVERNAVKGEWKDRRLGWINSDSIPISIPTPSPYVGLDAIATSGLLYLATRSTKSVGWNSEARAGRFNEERG
jgi:hypothetical protein